MALHPDFPVIEGDYRITREWSVTLPIPFNRRIEEGSLVLWRPQLTFWINVWGNDNNEGAANRIDWILSEASPDRRNEKVERGDGILRLTYELVVEDPQRDPMEFSARIRRLMDEHGLDM
jgi:hypothetical protein